MVQIYSHFEKAVIQWIPAHCDIPGNERADRLAKEGGSKEQTDKSLTYLEAKTNIKNSYNEKWKKQHPQTNQEDPYYKISRNDQVIIIRLRTGHCRLRHHLFHKLKIGTTDMCPCGEEQQTVPHVLQRCQLHEAVRQMTWPAPTQLQEKLFGSKDDLRRTARFMREIGIEV